MVLNNPMIKPRPLPKDRVRDYIHARNEAAITFTDELVLAETYWREVVKNSKERIDNGDGVDVCQYCHTHTLHLVNCPWLQAQE